jgi:FkbM family methyltransferase
MKIKQGIHTALRTLGFDITKYPPASHPRVRRKLLLDRFGVDTVLDIGANTGQFAQFLRNEVGFRGQILSFEPLSAAFDVLRQQAEADGAWNAYHCAIGDSEGRVEINVAGNSVSSSLLQMLPSHEKAAPDSVYIAKEFVDVKPLDSIFDDICASSKNVYMKIDTQGYESKVLRGAQKTLPRIGIVQLEMSLVPLYDGEPLLPEICNLMKSYGYTLIDLENGYADPASRQLLQVDGVFRRF